jgi:hypothetical protein
MSRSFPSAPIQSDPQSTKNIRKISTAFYVDSYSGFYEVCRDFQEVTADFVQSFKQLYVACRAFQVVPGKRRTPSFEIDYPRSPQFFLPSDDNETPLDLVVVKLVSDFCQTFPRTYRVTLAYYWNMNYTPSFHHHPSSWSRSKRNKYKAA